MVFADYIYHPHGGIVDDFVDHSGGNPSGELLGGAIDALEQFLRSLSGCGGDQNHLSERHTNYKLKATENEFIFAYLSVIAPPVLLIDYFSLKNIVFNVYYLSRFYSNVIFTISIR